VLCRQRVNDDQMTVFSLQALAKVYRRYHAEIGKFNDMSYILQLSDRVCLMKIKICYSLLILFQSLLVSIPLHARCPDQPDFLPGSGEIQQSSPHRSCTVPSGSHHSGGRGNVTINSAGVNIDNAFLEAQRHPTSTSMSIVETIEAVASATDMPLAQLKQEKLDDGGGVVLPLHVGVMQQPVASSSSGSSGSHGGTGNGGSNSGLLKPKREKRFTCCYCPWSGADKWGLKRHLNTHTKPFVCLLCDYKAARSERLATHVLKVHNKRACSKCSYLADTQEEYQAHMSDVQ